MLHPPWATHACRIECPHGAKEYGRVICEEHAKHNCPAGMEYAIRYLKGTSHDAWEWYAPAKPQQVNRN